MDLSVYRVREIGFGSTWETLFSYNFQADQTQNISEQGSFIFNYDPYEYAPPFNWSYGVSMNLYTPRVGFSSMRATYQESTAIADIDTFQVNLRVVPEPISSILFVTGWAVLGGRHFLRRKRKV